MKRKILLCFLLLGLALSCNEETLVLEGPSDDEVISSDDDATSGDENTNNDQNSGNPGNSNNNSTTCNNSAANEADIVDEILYLVNDHRQSIGKSTLTFNCVATQIAIEHTQYMIEQNQISHDGFSQRFQTLQQEVDSTLSLYP